MLVHEGATVARETSFCQAILDGRLPAVIPDVIVAGVGEDPVLRTLVGSLVTFGHGCGATVVAEGVETADDASTLLALGVDLGQGWFFGRPGPVEALGPAGQSSYSGPMDPVSTSPARV